MDTDALLGIGIVVFLAVNVAGTIWSGGPRAPSPRHGVPEWRRRFRGAVAGLGIALAGALGAVFAVGFVYLPVLRSVSGRRVREGSLSLAESLGATAVAAVALGAVAALIGASCVGPRRRGALRGVGLVTLTALAAVATGVSPLQPLVAVPLPLATAGAALVTLVAGGAALLAWPEEPAS